VVQRSVFSRLFSELQGPKFDGPLKRFQDHLKPALVELSNLEILKRSQRMLRGDEQAAKPSKLIGQPLESADVWLPRRPSDDMRRVADHRVGVASSESDNHAISSPQFVGAVWV
jgi:hypothetical protein